MDSHFKRILDELQKMETRLGDRIEGHCRGLERRVEEAVYDDEPIFDEEPVLEVELVLDEGPFFDEDLVLDEGPLFDEEPIDKEPSTRSISVLSTCSMKCPSDSATACVGDIPDATNAMSDHNTAARPGQPSSTSTIAKELVVDPVLAAAASSAMDIEPSTTNIYLPFNCSMKCLSGVTALAPMYIVANELSLNHVLIIAMSSATVIVPSKANDITPVNCSTKLVGGDIDVTVAVAVCAIIQEPVADLVHAVVASPASDIITDNNNMKAATICLTKCGMQSKVAWSPSFLWKVMNGNHGLHPGC